MTEKTSLSITQKMLLMIANIGLDEPSTQSFIEKHPKEWEELQSNSNIRFKRTEEDELDELNEMALIIPASFNNFRFSSSKIVNQLILDPISEVLATNYGVNVASTADKKDNKNVVTYLQILENSSIRLPEGFEFTEKVARYIDAVGSALEDDAVKENGGIIKVKHLINIINGKNASNVREEEINKVIHDLDVLSTVNIYLDATEHAEYNAKNKNKSQLTTTIYRDYLLPTGMRGGADGEKYIIIKDVPPLYQYAKELGHITTYRKHDLDLTRIYITDDAGMVVDEKKTSIKRMTERYNNIQGLFMRKELSRLNQIKKNSKKGSRPYIEVTYKYIYDYLQAQEPNLNIEHRKSDINKQIYNVLKVLKDKGLIDEFDAEIARGRVRKHKIRIF